MNFPPSLIQNNRPQFPKAKILLSHFVYARHKPGHDWLVKENIPDFEKIKIPKNLEESQKGKGQSFNWNLFSIPIWARFDDTKLYKEGYAIVAFSVFSIRRTAELIEKNSNTNPQFGNETLDIEHAPLENNYSHCNLTINLELNPTERRAIRMTLKHNSYVPLLPNQKRNVVQFFFDVLKMKLLRMNARYRLLGPFEY